MVVSIGGTTKEELVKAMESSTTEKQRASAEAYGGGEYYKEKECTNSLEELQTEWFGGRARLKRCVDDIQFI